MLEAEHTCMSMRGVAKPGALTVTTQFPARSATIRTSSCASSSWCARPALIAQTRARLATIADCSGVRPAGSWRTTFSERALRPQQPSDIEEGLALAPKFDADGLVTCVATDATTGEVLMVAHMNAEALRRTVETGEAWYYRARAGRCGGRARAPATCSASPRCASTATRTRSGSRSSSAGRAPATPDGGPASTGRCRSAGRRGQARVPGRGQDLRSEGGLRQAKMIMADAPPDRRAPCTERQRHSRLSHASTIAAKLNTLDACMMESSSCRLRRSAAAMTCARWCSSGAGEEPSSAAPTWTRWRALDRASAEGFIRSGPPHL